MLQTDSRLPLSNDIKQLKDRLVEIFRAIATEHNNSFMWHTAGTAAPTTGTWAQGDKCKNTTPTESGTAGSKYIVLGWCNVADGTPGTWKEMRVLTGG